MKMNRFDMFGNFLLICLSSWHSDGFSLSRSLSMPASKGTAIIAGGTGYIGKSTVRESVRQGYHTVVLVRDLGKVLSPEGQRLYENFFNGAEIVECDVSDPIQLIEVRTLGTGIILRPSSRTILTLSHYCSDLFGARIWVYNLGIDSGMRQATVGDY
jgi:NAD(P)-dependent dehydrogenase (short-subunit alcohol dehydrogenase family)